MNDLAWLPSRHYEAAITLAHVDEVAFQISELLFAYQDVRNEPLAVEEVINGLRSELRVSRIDPVPPKITRLVADAVNGLRAAVEHALFTEVEFLEGAPLEEAAARLVEMPAALTYEGFTSWTKRREKSGPSALRQGTELHRRIASLQPFQRTSDASAHPLARLAAYSNLAKHRNPNVAAVRVAAVLRDDAPPPLPRDLPRLDDRPVLCGDIVFSAPTGKRVEVTIFPTVGINLPGTAKWPVLVNELEEISGWVRKQAIPVIVTGDSASGSELPAWFDISRPQVNLGDAIHTGTTESAIARGRTRIAVTTARIDLVEVVAELEGAPPRAAIAAWLLELPDADVLQILSELRAQVVEAREAPREVPPVVVQMLRDAQEYSEQSGRHATGRRDVGSSTFAQVPPTQGDE